MPNWQRVYWWTFNAFVRFVGACFALVGGVFVLWGLKLVLDQKTTLDVGGVPTADPWIKGLVLVAGVVVGLLGLLLLKAKRYRPDPGDAPFTRRGK